MFRNIENGVNAIKAIYNYNKYNLIHTQVVVHITSTYYKFLNQINSCSFCTENNARGIEKGRGPILQHIDIHR